MKRTAALVIALLPIVAACTTTQQDVLTVYSGREESLVAPVFDAFTKATGIQVQVRYGDSAELAAQILEEGSNSPADVFFAQDGGALGAVSAEELLSPLSQATLDRVPEHFRADDGTWVGVSGRARTVVYNTDELREDELPASIDGFTDTRWQGKIGWAPTNASFQAFVTAFRVLHGDDAARAWLRGIKANDPVDYPKNTPVVQAVLAGEVEVGFVNHYYLLGLKADVPDAPAENHFIGGGDVGALVNVAGAAILASSTQAENAQALLDHLLSTDAQSYFATQTFEYPLIAGVATDPRLAPLDALDPPTLDLSDLADLETTLEMLADEGIL